MVSPEFSPDVAAAFPVPVTAFSTVGRGDIDWLLDEERAQVSHAGIARQTDFAAGRACGRAALRALGFAEQPLLAGPDRQPEWPDGAVGAISHTADYCVAVVGTVANLDGRTIGVDAETAGRVSPRLYRRLFTAPEQARLGACSELDGRVLATELFSAKEAFYKAQYPVTESWVGFRDVVVTPAEEGWQIDRASRLEALDLLSWPQPVAVLRVEGLVVTAAVALPA